jgi:hypothetical protein
MMKRKGALSGAVVGALIVAGAAAVALGRLAWNRATAAAVTRLHERADRLDGEAQRAFSPAALVDLPPPVARYFIFALPEAQPPIRAAKVRWSGEFRSRPDGGWAPFTARQHFTVRQPGFVWDAEIRMLPFAPVRVRDSFVNGAGSMLGRIAALVPVVDEGGTPEMAQSALARWLGEAVWFPTALLPGGPVRWEAVDDNTARALVSDGETQVEAEFHFAPSGAITSMRAMRYRDADGAAVLTPFEGRYGAYERWAGVKVPASAEVAWELPEGDFAYWRGRVEEIEYER